MEATPVENTEKPVEEKEPAAAGGDQEPAAKQEEKESVAETSATAEITAEVKEPETKLIEEEK